MTPLPPAVLVTVCRAVVRHAILRQSAPQPKRACYVEFTNGPQVADANAGVMAMTAARDLADVRAIAGR